MKSFFPSFILLFILLFSSLSSQAVPPISGGSEPRRPRVARPASFSQRFISPRQRSVGERNLAPKGLLILAQFTDLTFQSTNDLEAFEQLANGVTYTHNGAYCSAQAYFVAQSDGQYVPQFDVIGPVTLPHNYAYYGTNDASGYDQYTADFVMDAVAQADAEVDFTKYDNDKDGVIDFVYIIYAGKGEADGGNANTIWPHNWDMISNFYYGYTNQSVYYYKTEKDYRLPQYDGVTLNDYACSAELAGNGNRTTIGVICHEFSHVLGLPDYYTTSDDATVVENMTPGAWSLMGYGCYLASGNVPCNYSAFDKYYMQWVTPQVLWQSQTVTMPADGKTYFLVTRDGAMPADGAMTADTVYYIENRQYEGLDKHLPGHGMLVWQVVYDYAQWLNNTPNNYTVRYALLTADDSRPYSSDKWGGMKEGVPFPGNTNRQSLSLFGFKLEQIEESDLGVISFRFVNPLMPTALDDIETSAATDKVLHNGRLLILRNGLTYDLQGQRVK